MHVKATEYELDFAILFLGGGVGWGAKKSVKMFSAGFQGRMVDLGKPKDILLHTLSALGNPPALMDQFQYFPRPSFPGKLKRIPPLSPYSATQGQSAMGR